MTILKNQGRIIAAQAPQSAKRLYAQLRIRALFVLVTEAFDFTFSIVVTSYKSSGRSFRINMNSNRWVLDAQKRGPGGELRGAPQAWPRAITSGFSKNFAC